MLLLVVLVAVVGVVVVRALFFDRAHARVMPGGRRYNPRRNSGA
jgi:hypothetical protein